jgi:hypothetical protein
VFADRPEIITQPPIITVVGKAFFDIGHAPADHSNRGTDLRGCAAWEIHPVMKLDVLPEKQRAATWRKRDGSVAELRLLRLVDRLNVSCLCSSKAPIESIVSESSCLRDWTADCD